ncbi:uncharacterized protein LOC113548307 [Rhopalosiphum maidis]|uniref:uncharacterized protein LOC113548307 n=1 Tax=Rhopalosiphum maidis TaxID=43146 RepID=UPI000EFE4491|nr:uncharacterized protein LOC113548307 [Rhopalosiphum maidis]XP_060834158.1 uncharacterized protein LOC132917436 [Rhopalosiphum padi]
MARFLCLLLSTAALVVAAYGSPLTNDRQLQDGNGADEPGLTDQLQELIEKRDVSVELGGATVTLSPRNLDENELGLTLRLPSSAEPRSKRHKLKKILMPIMVFVMLKALTLIPLAIGVLGLKAWNALQLSFFSFVISIGLAIFQLVKKASESPPSLTTHDAGIYGAPPAHYARSIQEHAHQLAYGSNQVR